MLIKKQYKLLLVLVYLLASLQLWANVDNNKGCKFSDTLILNTGYNHATGGVYPLYGQDSFWTVTALTADCIPHAIQTLPYNAIILRNLNMINGYFWVNASNARWIGFRPNATGYGYPTNAIGLYDMTVTRIFKTCDSGYYRLKLNIAADNSVKSLRVNGGPSLFSQASGLLTGNFNTFHNLDTVIYLPEGTQRIDVVVNNFLEGVYHRDNAHGLIIEGLLTRSSAKGSVWSPLNGEHCVCPTPATLGVSEFQKDWIKGVIGQNYPNPFNKETRIEYNLEGKDINEATIVVVDVLGRKYYEERIPSGRKSFVTIDAQNLSQGVYYYYMVADGVKSELHKMSVLR